MINKSIVPVDPYWVASAVGGVNNSVAEVVVVVAVATWAVLPVTSVDHLDNPASDCEDDVAAAPSDCLVH